MKCPNKDQNCPVEACLGLVDHNVCDHISKLNQLRIISQNQTQEIQEPSTLEKAENLAKAMYDYVWSGFKNVDDIEKERRLSICRSCDFFNSELVECMKCGCDLNWKTRMGTSHCPLDPPKW